MERIYFDNAATTALAPEVFETMKPYFMEKFGNPSSIHSYGREVRLAIENARKSVASIINARPSDIIFTSGGTESTNTALHAAVEGLGCKTIITSPIEHHATLHTADYLQKSGKAAVRYVRLDQHGSIDLNDLEKLLQESTGRCVVTLMHGNNETGFVTDIEAVGLLCERYNAVFHSDIVQTLAHYPIDVKKLRTHFLSATCHKFHGPKGTGLLYADHNLKMEPFIHGGGQERNMRAGTENIYGIIGFAKALELAVASREKTVAQISQLRSHFASRLRDEFPDITFNNPLGHESLINILSIGFPKTEHSEMLLFNLDIHNICVSGGSACSSGAQTGSHVIQALHPGSDQVTVRFSFSRYNTIEEADRTIEVLKSIL